jgi:hypothetical protein
MFCEKVTVMPSDLLFLLIPAVALLVIVLAGVAIRRAQQSFVRVEAQMPGAGPGLYQSPGESREAFVRRNWQRPGVVANGETLVDLYDRIATLERRLASAEEQLARRQ